MMMMVIDDKAIFMIHVVKKWIGQRRKRKKERKKFIWISLMSEELAKNMQLMKLWLSVSFLSWMIFSDKTDRLAC